MIEFLDKMVFLKYKRIILKLSGEVLAGDKGHGIDFDRTLELANEIKLELDGSTNTLEETKDYYNNLTAATIVDYYNQALLAMED